MKCGLGVINNDTHELRYKNIVIILVEGRVVQVKLRLNPVLRENGRKNCYDQNTQRKRSQLTI